MLYQLRPYVIQLSKMTAVSTVSETHIPGLELVHRGKVRDVYKVDDATYLLVATDRLSAFWFDRIRGITPNHLFTTDTAEMPDPVNTISELRGRSMLVKKTTVFPVECVVRGYLEGSGWKDYQATGSVCGHELPSGMMH